MEQTWVTSDLHFRHQKVAELRGFASADKHDAHVEQMWRNLIDDTDVVWILGDITMNRWDLRKPESGLAALAALPGRKRLIHGNHDPSHPMHRSAYQPPILKALRETFEWVGTAAKVRSQGIRLLLNHFPYEGDSGPTQRHGQWRLPDMGLPIVHGHTHQVARYSQTSRGTAQVNVALDAWELAPVHIEDVLLTLSSRGQIP